MRERGRHRQGWDLGREYCLLTGFLLNLFGKYLFDSNLDSFDFCKRMKGVKIGQFFGSSKPIYSKFLQGIEIITWKLCSTPRIQYRKQEKANLKTFKKICLLYFLLIYILVKLCFCDCYCSQAPARVFEKK